MRTKRIWAVILATLGVLVLLAGCGLELAPEEKEIPTLRNDLAEGGLKLEHSLSGESFVFITSYDTDYDAGRWRVTDSKTLHMRAWIKLLDGKDVEVLVEHVHIDVCLKSKYAGLDGWSQDSMDDKLAVGDQPGFWITEEYFYENYFAIEGFSESLIEGWGYWVEGNGYVVAGNYRLTEKNLVETGKVYANKFQLVYDLLIRYPGETNYHTRSLVDEFLVPVVYTETVTTGE